MFVQPGTPGCSSSCERTISSPASSRPSTHTSDKSLFDVVKSNNDAMATSQQMTEPSQFLNTVLTGNDLASSEESSGASSTEQHITMSFENTTNDEQTHNEQNQSFDEITSDVDALVEHKQLVTTEELLFEPTASEEFVNQNTSEEEITEK